MRTQSKILTPTNRLKKVGGTDYLRYAKRLHKLYNELGAKDMQILILKYQAEFIETDGEAYLLKPWKGLHAQSKFQANEKRNP